MNWNASWIWCPNKDKSDNFYLYARKAVELREVPGQALVFVTAGALYKLYVNGQYVGRGPNPSDPSRYYYDVYDVASYLKKGANVLAAACYNYGPATQGVIKQNWGRGAFLLEMRASQDGATLAATDESWKVIQAPEWDQNSELNCNLFGDFKETYDSRKEMPGWKQADFDDAAWQTPEILGKPPMQPYLQLVEREIPFLGGEAVFPVRVNWESASVTYAWRDDWEVYHEHRLVPNSPHEDPKRIKMVEVFKTHADFSPSILLDYGKDVTGYPRITIASSGGGIIDVLYGETLSLVRVDRFILKGGRQVLEPFNRRTFRYMKLLFPETPKRIEIDSVNMEMNTYPVERKAEFSCSDKLLNQIWEIARHTIRMSMLDHFVDCPWRERTIYGGDVFAENLFAYYAFGDGRLNRKTLRQMFALQFPQGALPPFGPYSGITAFYPSWSAFFGLSFVDHYLLTGDKAFLDELWPGFSRLMDWAVREIDNNQPSLIGNPAKGGDFAAWSGQPKVRFGAWDNYPFLMLLQRAAGLAKERGETNSAARWQEAAGKLAEAIRSYLFDANGDCVAYPNTNPSAPANQGDIGYALWSNLLERGAALRQCAQAVEPGIHPLDGPFNAYFLTDGLFQNGEDQKALDYLRDYWGSMVQRGATTFWEHFNRTWPAEIELPRGTSTCHGWSAGPVYFLEARILGVRALSPGFSKVLIEPRPVDLQWASGAVPTPLGPVTVKWNRSGPAMQMNIDIPKGCQAVVRLPNLGPDIRWSLNGQTVDPAAKSLDMGSGAHVIAGA